MAFPEALVNSSNDREYQSRLGVVFLGTTDARSHRESGHLDTRQLWMRGGEVHHQSEGESSGRVWNHTWRQLKCMLAHIAQSYGRALRMGWLLKRQHAAGAT